MKKYSFLTICFSALLILSSCNEWLDVKPTTQIDRDELFSTEQGFGEALRGVYALMSAPGLYGRHLTWGLLDVFAGVYLNNLQSFWNSARQYAFLRDGSFRDDQLAHMVESFWTSLYNAIANVNSMLGEISNRRDVFTGYNYYLLKGEAIGLRAFLHFEILRLYADIYERSRDEPVMPFVSTLAPLVTPDFTGGQIISIVISELEEAVRLLENDPMRLGAAPPHVLASLSAPAPADNIHPWHNRRFRFNYFAAKATLARAHLWRGDNANALRMAQYVIAAQETHFPWVLPVTLGNIGSPTAARQDRTFATEHIFALNIMNLDQLIAGHHDNTAPTDVNNLFIRPDAFPVAEQGVDPRFFRLTGVGPGVNRFPLKFHQNPRVAAHFRNRLPLIRISEMFYIAAETSPNWVDGLQYLQAVRIHRGLGAFPLTVTNAEELQIAIRDEHRREFIGEGQLWHYYKRTQADPPVGVPVGTSTWRGVHLYVFPRPESEDIYGGRR